MSLVAKWDGLDDLKKMFSDLEGLPEAVADGVNQTAWGLRKNQQDLIRRTFPNANPATVRNITVKQANKQTRFYDRRGIFTRAVVQFDQMYRRGVDEYMLPLIEGGPRKKKAGETLLGHYYVPGAGAQLDQYGNIKGGQVQQILSYLQKFRSAGFAMNRAVSRKTAQGKGMNDYFMVTSKTGGLHPGVYMRVDKGQGQMMYARALANKQRGQRKADVRSKLRGQLERGLVPVLIFVDKPPQYRSMLPFFASGQEYVDKHLADNVAWHVKRLLNKSGR